MSGIVQIENSLAGGNDHGDVRLGLVRVKGISAGSYPPGFEEALAARIADEQAENPPEGFDAEERRKAARDMLRNGSFKPTGRSKPASEYLIRAARTDAFPRINAPADINNLISLEERLPISLWDVDKAGVDRVVFRLGEADESYVFNPSGQEIDVSDLVCGCGALDGGEERPFVNPVKDALRTRTDDTTTHVLAAIYAPATLVRRDELERICNRFADWLAGTAPNTESALAIADPGESIVL